MDLTISDGGAAGRTSGDFLVRGLAAAGFNVKLKLVTNDDWYRIASYPLDQSKTQLFRNGWYPDYPDPQGFCNISLRSGQPSNTGGWRNSTYDQLVDHADRLLNRKNRAALYICAQHIALNQGAFISVSNQLGFALIKPYVHGMVEGVANDNLVPKNGDWANVLISKH